MLLRKISPEKRIQVGRYYAGIGGFAICSAILLDRFVKNIGVDFVIGLLYGLSVAFNLTGIYLLGRSIRKSNQTEPNTPMCGTN